MIKMFNKRTKNQKGFTLIELIVVIAIIGILGAIAVPRFSGIRVSSAVKADAATANQIINAARIQETETGVKVTSLVQTDDTTAGVLKKVYMTVPTTGGTGATFGIGGGGNDPYHITFTPNSTYNPYSVQQVVRENAAWVPSETAVTP